MIARALQGLGLGAIAGVAIGSTPMLDLGPLFWGVALASVGAFQGWIGWWILKQSMDFPKMRAAVPLTGPVLASIPCLLTGEGFLVPVLATLVVGVLLGWILTTTTPTSA